MYCLLIVPEEIFGYKKNDRLASQFSDYEENAKRFSGYFEIIKPLHRSTTYTWLDDHGNVKCVVTCSYYDFKTKTEVPGYVSSITFYGKYATIYNK
jgi:hypothetical protein